MPVFVRLLSFTPHGVDALPIEVEVDVSNGLPAFEVVGLPGSSIREARDRVRSALRNSGCEFPARRITVNLGPADVRKEGCGLDLAMALGLLAATRQVPANRLHGVGAIGELSLDGSLRPVPGMLAMALAARDAGVEVLLAPAAGAGEAALAGGTVLAAESLKEVLDWLRYGSSLPTADPAAPVVRVEGGVDLAEVQGQAVARRALEVAAAGGHNLLLMGPPGAGKSLLARSLPGILPPLTPAEAMEVTRIHGAVGASPGGLVTQRPFRAPHHSASRAALLGGGDPPRPGEVSLAHRGVLFLDELPEFSRDALEGLRQPLEEGTVQLVRTRWRLTFPARCMLVAAANPCRCGYAGDPGRPCQCQVTTVLRYRERLSGPLLDRIDLQIRVPAVAWSETRGPAPEPSAAVADRVTAARERQQRRLTDSGLTCNAELPPRELRRYLRLASEAEGLLLRAMERTSLSLRGRDRVLKVALTIADLAGSDVVSVEHVGEALQYRVG